MVGPARGRVHEAPSHALNKHQVRDLEVEDLIDADATRGEHAVKLLGLRQIARKPIEDEACPALWRLHSRSGMGSIVPGPDGCPV